jgi:hypothetical protein
MNSRSKTGCITCRYVLLTLLFLRTLLGTNMHVGFGELNVMKRNRYVLDVNRLGVNVMATCLIKR